MAKAIANKSAAPPTWLAAPENLAGVGLVVDPFVPTVIGVEVVPACGFTPAFDPPFELPILDVPVGLLTPTPPLPPTTLLVAAVT